MRLCFLLALLLPACTSMAEGGEKAAHDSTAAFFETREKLKEMFTYHPKPKELKPVPTRYCYRVMQDIMCYADPQPGAEGRLVAYQGAVEVPIEAADKPAPLARSVAPDQPIQPIFVMPPPAVKESSGAK